MDQAKDALMAELIDTAIQQHSVACEAKGKAPIFVERASANVLLVRQRDASGLNRTFRVEVRAAIADVAAQYLTEAA